MNRPPFVHVFFAFEMHQILLMSLVGFYQKKAVSHWRPLQLVIHVSKLDAPFSCSFLTQEDCGFSVL